MSALHDKYRPQEFSEVYGHEDIVRALQGMIADDSSHSYVLAGPSGTGKTTLARIAAKQLGAEPSAIVEVAAAVYNGVDAMRDLISMAQYKPLDSEVLVYILDEAQRLSTPAWEALLKIVEEPPSHVYWFFCTTEIGKIPRTIMTRSVQLTLRELSVDMLCQLVEDIAGFEGINLPEGVASMIADESAGSPRQALSFLATCAKATTREEASELLTSAQGSDTVRKLCQMLADNGRGGWKRAMSLVGEIDEDPESTRIIVTRYMAKAAMGANGDQQACYFLSLLEAFSQPYNRSDGKAPLIRSIGQVLFAGGGQ